jgi:hypothetical protein
MHSGIVLGGKEMGSRQYHPNPPTVSVVLFCCIFVASCSTAHAVDPLWKCFLFISFCSERILRLAAVFSSL